MVFAKPIGVVDEDCGLAICRSEFVGGLLDGG
jgi:hypothetical protein